jgi:malate dehydrogenase
MNVTGVSFSIGKPFGKTTKPAAVATPSITPPSSVLFAGVGRHHASKVSIIGAGNVGTSIGINLGRGNVCEKVTMIDLFGDFAKGKALDIQQATSFYPSNTQFDGSGDLKDLKDSDVVVITAGVPRKEGQSRDDLLEGAVKIMANTAGKIKQYAPHARILVVSNPLDVMCQTLQMVTGFPPEQIIGVSALDVSRYRASIARALKVSPNNVQGMVVGEHGDSMVPLHRYTTVGGIPVTDLLSKKTLDKIAAQTRDGGKTIVDLTKTSSSVAIGAVVSEMTDALLHNKNIVIPASAHLNGEYGVHGLYVGVPVILGAKGCKVLKLKLTPDEQALFDKSVAAIRKNVDKVPAVLQKLAATP